MSCQSITGIALPVGSDKLYSGSKDGTLRVWDCYNGQVIFFVFGLVSLVVDILVVFYFKFIAIYLFIYCLTMLSTVCWGH